MKKIICALLMALGALTVSAQVPVENPDTVYTVHSIDQQRFRDVIADWSAHDWVMKSEHPVVIDFYADWCAPCRRLAPILRDIAHHYQGTVDFYRVNVDDNPDIASAFEIRSIPMLLICPLQGDPKSIVGLYPMQEYIRVIDQALGK